MNESVLRQGIRKLASEESTRRVPTLCTGLAILLLGPVTAKALSLGEISIRSTLGEPLHATVPIRLAPGESLAGSCVTATASTGGAGALAHTRISHPQTSRTGTHTIQVTTVRPLVEPMYELALQVNCPGAPIIVRQYVLMLDLPGTLPASGRFGPDAVTVPQPVPVTASNAVNVPPARRSPAPASRPADGMVPTTRPREPLASGIRYRVRAGDTLSSIAARVTGRTGTLWQMADAIHAANPEAFIRNNPDLIRLGSEILIPGSAPIDAAPAAVVATATAARSPAIDTDTRPVTGPVIEPTVAPVPTAATTIDAATSAAHSIATTTAVAAEPAPETVPPARPATTPAGTGATSTQTPTQAAVPAAAPEPVAPQAEVRPWVAAAAGALFGLVVSAILWFRRVRLPWPRPAVAASGQRSRELPEPASAAATIKILPIQTDRKPEPAFTVSYSVSEHDDPLAGEFASANDGGSTTANHTLAEEITAELAELFDADVTTEQPSLQETDHDTDRESEYFAAADQDGDETVSVPTSSDAEKSAGTPASLDLPTLVGADGADDEHAQTLMEALSLLERDYQEEFTASQVLDLDAVRAAMDKEDQEPTQLRRKLR